MKLYPRFSSIIFLIRNSGIGTLDGETKKWATMILLNGVLKSRFSKLFLYRRNLNDLLNPRRSQIARQELKNWVQSNNGDWLKFKSVSQRSSVTKFYVCSNYFRRYGRQKSTLKVKSAKTEKMTLRIAKSQYCEF